MDDLYRALLPAKDTFHMHQTAHVGPRDIFGSMNKMIGHPVLPHLDGYGFFCHTEGTTESAAFVFPVQLDQLDPGYHLQQPLRLGKRRGHQFAHLRELQSPLAMTALVNAHLMGKSRLQLLDLQYIGKEFRQFIDPLADTHCRIGIAPGRMQMLFDMKDATAGGADDMIKFMKVFNEQLITSMGQVLETGIGHWLATTGLSCRIDYLAPKLLQELQGGNTNPGIELIYITRDKKTDTHNRLLKIKCPAIYIASDINN